MDGAADGICSVEPYERYEREAPEQGEALYGQRARRYVLPDAGPYPEYTIEINKQIATGILPRSRLVPATMSDDEEEE